MPPNAFRTLSQVRALGFEGIETVAALRASRLLDVPATAGVYLILRNPRRRHRFMSKSPAGRFKRRDPSVDPRELSRAWVKGTWILYIGKAGGPGSRATLLSRIRTYLSHGTGKHAGHWGGRYIWQLAGSSDLLVAWKVMRGGNPRNLERRLLLQFEEAYDNPPFANRVR